MKKVFVIFFLTAAVLLVGFSGTVLAAEEAPYERVLNSINNEFGLELGYVPVDESKVSIEDYERTVRELAIQQRKLLDYISLREKQSLSNSEALFEAMDFTPYSTITKTKTRPCWNFPDYFTITVTYDVTGNQVSSLRNAYHDATTAAILGKINFIRQGDPICNIIDGGRTGTVQLYGEYRVRGIFVNNVTLYSEFPWDA